MEKRKKLILGSVVALAALGAGTAGAIASSEEQQSPITGSALEKASAAALAHTGGGKVTETEVGDEDAYYEVEVTKDGKEVDVHLDKDFDFVNVSEDGDAAGDSEGGRD